MLRAIDEMLECAVMHEVAVRKTARNIAKRDLRYLLELSVKALYVDQAVPTATYDQRRTFFARQVSAKGLERELRQLSLYLLDEGDRQNFRAAVMAAYGVTSQYVHPSPAQIEERLSVQEAGAPLGFDNADVVSEFASLAFDVYGLVGVLVLHSLGGSTAGDVMESVYGEDAGWEFRRHTYVGLVDAHFDYKAERGGRVAQLQEWRRPVGQG